MQPTCRHPCNPFELGQRIGARGIRVGEGAELKDTLKEPMREAERKGVVLLGWTTDQRQTNPGGTGSAHNVFCAHIPWHEPPPKGRPSMAAYPRRRFSGLNDELERKAGHPQAFLPAYEFGYAPRCEYFEA
jgi:hypothetical protein